ncbi:MAG: hypothetical protein HY928_09940 [Elusimicrobia bacterium]|nr:hypothetical protein [Elusimicrobiota bacterium]
MRALLASVLLAATASAAVQPMPLRHDPKCVLEAVAFAMNVRIDPARPLPSIQLETKTPLAEFQRAAKEQWGTEPDVFTNLYWAAEEKIFLIEDVGYYTRLRRDIADSLAHEYAHYVQVHYKGYKPQDLGWGEDEAIHIQTWFRDNYIRGTAPAGAPACAPR